MKTSAADRPALSVTDWRGWSTHRVAPLLEQEAARWLRAFFWDQRWALTRMEAARVDGRLPGAIVTGGEHTPLAWTYFLRHQHQLQIGTIVSHRPDATRALVDGALASPHAEDAAVLLFSPDAPGLVEALHAHGLRTEPYDYLVRVGRRATPLAPANPRHVRAIHPITDAESVAALLGAAYRETAFLRPFVPDGEPDEWLRYVHQLIDTRGCGTFLPEASVLAGDGAPNAEPVGAVLATQLSQDTGHIAQVGVAAQARGGGLARQLIEHSLLALQAGGLDRVSLLVARSNAPARRVYAALGFEPAGLFVTGVRQP
jgi:ribosomal protein S18 acetylase RimI-like enzyme